MIKYYLSNINLNNYKLLLKVSLGWGEDIIYRKYNARRNEVGPKRRHRAVWLIVTLVAVLVVCIDFYIRPILNRAVSYQTRLITTNIVSDATYNVLDMLKLDYDDIVKTSRLDDNEISTIQTNVNATNQIKSQIINEITTKLNSVKNFSYKIPLGTVLGNDYLIDRGPDISFRLTPMGYANGELSSSFSSVGINQTHHQIILTIDIQITTLIPMHNASTTVTTNYVVAETVIVGKVPQYYTSVTSDDDKLKSDIVDFEYGLR